MIVRKMLKKFHDNPELLKRKQQAAGYGFDPQRAERVRATDYSVYTKEEKEWKSVDIILHPAVWKFYTNHDKTKNNIDRRANISRGGVDPMRADEVDGNRRANVGQTDLLSSLGKILGEYCWMIEVRGASMIVIIRL